MDFSTGLDCPFSSVLVTYSQCCICSGMDFPGPDGHIQYRVVEYLRVEHMVHFIQSVHWHVEIAELYTLHCSDLYFLYCLSCIFDLKACLRFCTFISVIPVEVEFVTTFQSKVWTCYLLSWCTHVTACTLCGSRRFWSRQRLLIFLHLESGIIEVAARSSRTLIFLFLSLFVLLSLFL